MLCYNNIESLDVSITDSVLVNLRVSAQAHVTPCEHLGVEASATIQVNTSSSTVHACRASHNRSVWRVASSVVTASMLLCLVLCIRVCCNASPNRPLSGDSVIDAMRKKCSLQSLLLDSADGGHKDGRSLKAIREHRNRLAAKPESRFEASVAHGYVEKATIVHELSKVSNVQLLSNAALREKLLQLTMENLSWPTDVQVAFLGKDVDVYIQKHDWSQVVRITIPWGDAAFDAISPTLASIKGSSKFRCDVMKKLVFVDLIAPFLHAGDAQLENIEHRSVALVDQYTHMDVLEYDMTCCTYHQDVITTARYLKCLSQFPLVVASEDHEAVKECMSFAGKTVDRLQTRVMATIDANEFWKGRQQLFLTACPTLEAKGERLQQYVKRMDGVRDTELGSSSLTAELGVMCTDFAEVSQVLPMGFLTAQMKGLETIVCSHWDAIRSSSASNSLLAVQDAGVLLESASNALPMSTPVSRRIDSQKLLLRAVDGAERVKGVLDLMEIFLSIDKFTPDSISSPQVVSLFNEIYEKFDVAVGFELDMDQRAKVFRMLDKMLGAVGARILQGDHDVLLVRKLWSRTLDFLCVHGDIHRIQELARVVDDTLSVPTLHSLGNQETPTSQDDFTKFRNKLMEIRAHLDWPVDEKKPLGDTTMDVIFSAIKHVVDTASQKDNELHDAAKKASKAKLCEAFENLNQIAGGCPNAEGWRAELGVEPTVEDMKAKATELFWSKGTSPIDEIRKQAQALEAAMDNDRVVRGLAGDVVADIDYALPATIRERAVLTKVELSILQATDTIKDKAQLRTRTVELIKELRANKLDEKKAFPMALYLHSHAALTGKL